MKPRSAARPASDLSRFTGFGAGAVTLIVTVAAGFALAHGPSSLAAPGPLALPHRALACADCHSDRPASGACSGCHGAHFSSRAAHRALALEGRLGCPTCHAIHRAEAGLALTGDGRATFFDTGVERQLELANQLAVMAGPVHVPLVAREACAACHDLARETDPANACFANLPDGRKARYNSCFDEHRSPASPSASKSSERDAAIELARLAARRLPRELTSTVFSSGAPVALGGLAALLTIVVSRRRRRRSSPPALAVVPATIALPRIDAERCLGCSACVDVCPYDVLEVRRYVAVVARPELCCGAASCLDHCPNGSLSLLASSSSLLGPVPSPALESPAHPGLYLAGDISGGSLIRNAVEQGVAAARAILAAARPPASVIIVGAGPAGLAAALTLAERGRPPIVLEQAGIAESIRRFSRDKLVLDSRAEPGDAELPLFVGECDKEELVRRWLRTVRRAGLAVREGERVLAVERRAGSKGGFRVRVVDAAGREDELVAERVVLATGRRGSPKLLDAPIAESAAARVHYELSDARAFAGKRVVVVGLGDVAMETALALALQEGTTVSVVHRGRGFSRGKRRNVEALGRRVAEGRVGLFFEAEVTRVSGDHVTLATRSGPRELRYDSLFVHIGRNPSELVPS